jgi:hypothetical protein
MKSTRSGLVNGLDQRMFSLKIAQRFNARGLMRTKRQVPLGMKEASGAWL